MDFQIKNVLVGARSEGEDLAKKLAARAIKLTTKPTLTPCMYWDNFFWGSPLFNSETLPA